MINNTFDVIKNVCRICAKEEQSRPMIPIFGENGKKQNILEKIYLCLPIEPKENENMPKQICLTCLIKLDEAYEFRNLCKSSQFRIEKMLNSFRQYGSEDHEETTTASEVYNCGICHKLVRNNDQGIGCEGHCQLWYHRKCVGMSYKEYSRLKYDIKSVWVCAKCSVTKPSSFPPSHPKQRASIERKIEGLSESRPIVYGTSAVICLQPVTPPPPPVAPAELPPVEGEVAAPQSDPLQPVMMTYVPSAVQPAVATTVAAPAPATEGVYPQTLIQVPTTPGSEPIIYQNRQPSSILPASAPTATPLPVPAPATASRRRVPQPKPMTTTPSLLRTSSLSTKRPSNERVNSPSNKRAFLCKYCNKTFPDDIIDHHVSLHLRQSFITCLDCNKNFRSEEAMNRHRCGANDLITLSDEEDLIIVSQS